eukprot:jgi/Psemu1/282198/fgenesh1_pg.4_\
MTILVPSRRWAATVTAAVALLATVHGWTATEPAGRFERSHSRSHSRSPTRTRLAAANAASEASEHEPLPTIADADNNNNNNKGNNQHHTQSRRTWLATAAATATAGSFLAGRPSDAFALEAPDELQRSYSLEFPTLFDPIYGTSSRATIKRSLSETETIWALEQNLELGPLQTPCGARCGSASASGGVSHVVVPTYALEHKVFVKECLKRWPNAELWTSPGQFSFPWKAAPDALVFGKAVDGVLGRDTPPWSDEIDSCTLEGGTFSIGGKPTTLCETAFFHMDSKSLIVTDSLARVPTEVPPLNDPERLLLVSKRCTSDPMPEDTPEARLVGWKKTALLVSYFFPEHEELDPDHPGTVVWTEGWDDNFEALSGKLIVPPVVRTLIYAQNPSRVKEWVEAVSSRWEFGQIVPAHFEAPIAASPSDLKRAFAFLDDPSIDAFPENDLARGLKPIADLALNRL